MEITEPGTVDDLIADATAYGYQATPRLVLDWVAAGLLDRPARRAMGRGKGSSKGVYSAHQRELFLALLSKRGPDARRVSTLARLPIFMWLRFGDDYVPTRQVVRAMRTWLGDSRASKEVARKGAREMLGVLDHPAASAADRSELLDVLADVGWKGRIDDGDRLVEAVRRVFEPPSVFGRLVRADGHPAAMLTADAAVGLINARVTAALAIQGGHIDDAALERARQMYVISRVEYLQRLPALRAQASERFVALLAEPTLQESVDNCGRDLLTLLGLDRLRIQHERRGHDFRP